MLSVCLWIPPYQLLNAWTNLNGFIHKSLPTLYVSVWISPIVARQRLSTTITAATNTHATIKRLLDAWLSMQRLSYQRNVGDYVFQEFCSLNITLSLNNHHLSFKVIWFYYSTSHVFLFTLFLLQFSAFSHFFCFHFLVTEIPLFMFYVNEFKIKSKISLCLINYVSSYEDVWGSRIIVPPILTLALVGSGRLASRPGLWTRGKEAPVPIGYETGWVPEPVCRLLRREISVALAGKLIHKNGRNWN
jgi:hypothetical protein